MIQRDDRGHLTAALGVCMVHAASRMCVMYISTCAPHDPRMPVGLHGVDIEDAGGVVHSHDLTSSRAIFYLSTLSHERKQASAGKNKFSADTFVSIH